MENRTIVEKVLLENMDLKNKNEGVYSWLFGDEEFPWDLWMVKRQYEESDKVKPLEEVQLEFVFNSMVRNRELDAKECDKRYFEEQVLEAAKETWFEKECFEMLTWQFDYKKWRWIPW